MLEILKQRGQHRLTARAVEQMVLSTISVAEFEKEQGFACARERTVPHRSDARANAMEIRLTRSGRAADPLPMNKRRAPATRTRKRALPAALAKRASSLVKEKRARLLAEAKGLVALVKRRKQQIAEGFYDLGVALRRLKDKEMLLALGCTTFADLCTNKLELATSMADRLVAVATTMSRDEVIGMDQARAFALVELAAATPEDDTPAQLARKTSLSLPHGRQLDATNASGREIERAAKSIREERAAPGKPRRGNTSTPDERATAAALQKALQQAGMTSARVSAVATKPGHASNVRIEHVPLHALAKLAKAITSLNVGFPHTPR